MSDDAHATDELRRRVAAAVGAAFEIEEELGRGGSAIVYRARDTRLRRSVAIKVLPPELAFRRDVRARFLREAQLAAQLLHPGIVPIYAVDEAADIVWFAMRLVEGESLAARLAREARPSTAFVRRVLRDVAAALACAHERGVVHRDVKPDNILIEDATGRALVSDFGIAHAAEGDQRLTATGVAVGTPAYMSPEQAMGEKDVDGRADIYALGVVGWQMLVGRLPFQSENTPGMLMKHISEPPPRLHELRPDLPPNLVYAIERAMAKSRAARWHDALAFSDALADDAPPPAEPFSDTRTPLEAAPVQPAAAVGAPAALDVPAPSPMKPWRFDPRRDPALASVSGESAIREWREQRRIWRERRDSRRGNRHDRTGSRGGAGEEPNGLSRDDEVGLMHEPLTSREERRAARRERLWSGSASSHLDLTPEDRIRRVQRETVRFLATSGFLGVLNALTSPRLPWFIIPVFAMGVGLLSRVRGLWVDGIALRRLFRRQPLPEPGSGSGVDIRSAAYGAARDLPPGATALAAAAHPPPLDLAGVPADVLAGPHGASVREAAEARAAIAEVVSRLGPDERLALPDVNATAAALEERVRALASAVHQLDRDASPAALARLDQRLAHARGAADSGGNEEARRVALLERQQTTLRDLAERRASVANQLESASLLLQTIRFDMLKLRSTGVESRIADMTLATQEARAVAVDIERLVDAAREVRDIQQGRNRGPGEPG